MASPSIWRELCGAFYANEANSGYKPQPPNDQKRDLIMFNFASPTFPGSPLGTPQAGSNYRPLRDGKSADKILVVDDEPEILEEIIELLEDEGYDCIGSTHADHALATILNEPNIATVITDIRMPGLDGLEMARQIKGEKYANRDIALIVMTGHAGMAEAIEALKIGAQDFLTKPISPEYLLITVKRALELSQLRRKDRNFVHELSREVKRRTAEVTELADKLRAANTELTRKNADLELAARMKDEFLSMISHEMNTPLNAITGFAHILEESLSGSGEEKKRENAGYILRAGERLMKSIRSILTMADIQAGRITAERQPVIANDILQNTTSEHQKAANDKSIELELVVDDGTVLVADPSLLKTAVGNLVENAIRFSDDNGAVRVEAAETDDTFTITVTDTGPGMAPEIITVALQPFQQADGSLARRFEGLGMGLPIARKIAELHGGAIGIESTPGAGTTVTLTIPKGNIG